MMVPNGTATMRASTMAVPTSHSETWRRSAICGPIGAPET